jgi:methyl-accepting chemotaxis protein
MNITVANSIRFGFGSIIIILVIMGAMSIRELSNIGKLTSQVNSLSIPALVHSSQLQVQFLKMGENALDDFHTNNLPGLDEVEQKFAANHKSFISENNKLESIVAQDPQLKSALMSVSATSDIFVANVKELFESHRQQLTLDVTIKEQKLELEEAVDDAGSMALDLLDASGLKTQAEDAANALETDLGVLLDLVMDLASESSRSDVETVATEIAAATDALAQKSAVITDESSGDAAQMATDLAEKITGIIAIANGDNSIINNKKDSLAAYDTAKNALALSQTNIASGIEQLNTLFERATKVANDTQSSVSDSITGGEILTIVMVIIAFVVAAIVGQATLNSISKPLREVNSMLKIVASGDLTQRLNDSSENEFGQLAKNCNTLIDSLRTLIEGIITRSTQLAAASEETSAITTETTQAIQNQRSQMEQAATATTEMSSTSQSVMHSADEALHEIKHADSESQRVKTISEQNKQTITQLAVEVEDASRVINKLHSDSASIGGILDVIRGIADQTNLLALNAAIEAARAGEQGRGFAVVADEVRSLASKTQESTQEIQAMIQVLQAGAEEAVDVMEKGKRQAESCVEQTEIADAALISITNAVHQTHDASEQISTAAQEQHQVSQEISERLESIVLIAEQTACGADQTAISSHEVARLSEELRLSVDEFKV